MSARALAARKCACAMWIRTWKSNRFSFEPSWNLAWKCRNVMRREQLHVAGSEDALRGTVAMRSSVAGMRFAARTRALLLPFWGHVRLWFAWNENGWKCTLV